MLSSGLKHQGDSTGSQKSHLSVLLEHTVAAIERFVARKRKKKPSAASTASLQVAQEHPVLVSTLALLLHHRPQLVSKR